MADMMRKGRNAKGAGSTGVSGEAHWNAKLTDGDVAAIRDHYSSGVKQSEIAAMFGVCQSTVSLVVRARRRRNK
jgi:hypothetical protein